MLDCTEKNILHKIVHNYLSSPTVVKKNSRYRNAGPIRLLRQSLEQMLSPKPC